MICFVLYRAIVYIDQIAVFLNKIVLSPLQSISMTFCLVLIAPFLSSQGRTNLVYIEFRGVHSTCYQGRKVEPTTQRVLYVRIMQWRRWKQRRTDAETERCISSHWSRKVSQCPAFDSTTRRDVCPSTRKKWTHGLHESSVWKPLVPGIDIVTGHLLSGDSSSLKTSYQLSLSNHIDGKPEIFFFIKNMSEL